MRSIRAVRALRAGSLTLLGTFCCAAPFRAASADEAKPAADPAARISAFRFATDDRVRRNVDLERVRKGIPRPDPRDGIPAIREPQVVAAADADFLKDDEPVLGLAVGGEARAYARRILDVHEVANDVLGGVPVAMTYCPLCDAGVAFRRDFDYDATRTDEPPLTFGISGYLYDSDVLIYDHETETFWHQLTAAAAVGPMTGARLETLPVVRTTWKAWRETHPATTALSFRTEHKVPYEAYGAPHYAEYRASKQLMFPVAEQDARLPRKATVYGLSSGAEHVAIPWDSVKDRTEPLLVDLGGRRFRVTTDARAGTLRAEARREDPAGGPETYVEVPILACYWFAWFAFHPKTAVWAAREDAAPR